MTTWTPSNVPGAGLKAQAGAGDATLNITFHPKQKLAFDSDAREILYGGAKGGGKSALMRFASVIWCAEIPGLQVYLFRRIMDDLIRNHVEGPRGYRALLNPWVKNGLVQITENEVRFWNGSKIYLCHCAEESDRFKYQGAEMHVLLMDELTLFTEDIYRFFRANTRCTGIEFPEKYKGRFPRIICGSNPGGIGHDFVKRAWVDRLEPFRVCQMPPLEGGMTRQYIPARLSDNPSMLLDDPTYEARLDGLGSPALVKAYKEGDWNIILGAFFPEFSAKHLLPPFPIPIDWARFRSFDWGSFDPFAVGWWCVAGEDFELEARNVADENAKTMLGLEGPRFVPKGSLICYREWYGANEDKGLKLPVEQIADGIFEREDTGRERILYSVTGKDCFAKKTGYGGPSIAERFKLKGISFRPADYDRVAGWDEMRNRLQGIDNVPMIYWFSTCHEAKRLIPSMQHDEAVPEDMSDYLDHYAEMCRYACMSRPTLRTKKEPKRIRGLSDISLNDLWKDRKKAHSTQSRI